eukprot:gene12216-12302_t
MRDDSIPNTFLGYLMMAVGGMIAALCGSCTIFSVGALVLPTFEDASQILTRLDQLLPVFMMVMMVGGIPTVAGAILFVSGLRRVGLIDKKGQKPPYKI